MTDAVADAVTNEVETQTAVADAAAIAAPPVVKDGAAEIEAPTAKVEEVEAAEVVYDFKVPEGFEVGADGETLKTFAKEHKLPAEAAQKLVDIAVAREQARTEAHAKQVKDWADEVNADKELGGQHSKETRALAAKALALAPPGVVEMLDASGLGNFPPLVRWARDIGKALSEDTHVPASGEGVKIPKNVAERLYGNTQLRN